MSGDGGVGPQMKSAAVDIVGKPKNEYEGLSPDSPVLSPSPDSSGTGGGVSPPSRENSERGFSLQKKTSRSVIVRQARNKKQTFISKASYALLLCYEAGAGNITGLKTLYMQGAPKDACDYDKRTPLMIAAAEGHIDVVKFLVEKVQVDINAIDRWGENALFCAETAENQEITEYLKARGGLELETRGHALSLKRQLGALEEGESDEEDNKSGVDESLARYAKQGSIAELKSKLQGGADANETDGQRRTALHHAAKQGDPDAVQMLLDYGADPTAFDAGGESPLSTAMTYKNGDVVDQLRDLPNPELTTWSCENDSAAFVMFNNFMRDQGISRNFLSEAVDASARQSLQEFSRILKEKGVGHNSIQDLLGKSTKDSELIGEFLQRHVVMVAEEDQQSSITERELTDFKRHVIAGMSAEQMAFAACNAITIRVRRKRHGDLSATSYTIIPLSDILAERVQIFTPTGVVFTGAADKRYKVEVLTFLFRYLGFRVRASVPHPLRMSGGDYIPAGDLCFFGTGLHTDEAALRWIMENGLIGHKRVVVVRDMFDRSDERAVLDSWFKMIDSNVILVLDSVLGERNVRRRIVDEWLHVGRGRYTCTQTGVELSVFLEKEMGYHILRVPESSYRPGFGVMNFGNGNLVVQDDEMLRLLQADPLFQGSVSKVDTRFTYEFFERSTLMFRTPSPNSFQPRPIPPPKEVMSFLSAVNMGPGPRQTTCRIAMVAPVGFQTNPETLLDNYFMSTADVDVGEVERRALLEMSALHRTLTEAGVVVCLFSSERFHRTPDAVFPNNWFSTHPASETGKSSVIFYPMKTESRRNERRQHIVSLLQSHYEREISLTQWEQADFPHFLESTGVLIMDRVQLVAYAALSQRCYAPIAETWAKRTGYKLCLFHASDEQGRPIYHTNVMMSVGTKFAVVCLESIKNVREKASLMLQLSATHTIIDISLGQVHEMCGNCLELSTVDGRRVLAMSTRAYNGFTAEQRSLLLEHVDEILHSDITTIEDVGGGSVRCMMAELF